MFIFTKAKVISLTIVFILLHFLWPVYETLAHKSKMPFWPLYHFELIPKDTPSAQYIVDEQFKSQSSQALELITERKTSINAPGISAAVAIDGQVVWHGGAGWANIENQVPVNSNTLFRIGSTSKALTATGLARLVDKDQVDLDKPITGYMNDIPLNWQKMTLRQLASHTAGLPHYKSNTDYLGLYKTMSLSNRYSTPKEALTVFDGSELLFKPGQDFSYSSFGTVLLSAVMADAVQVPFLSIMEKQVFGPIEMVNTKAEFQVSDHQQLAEFYWNDGGKQNHVRPWRDVDLSHRLAGGGFVSTSADLVKLGSAWLDEGYISQQTQSTFWTPQTLPDGTKTPNGYSIGWRVKSKTFNQQATMIAHHGGVSRGAQSWLMVLPEYSMAIAVNINSNTEVFWDFASVSTEIAELFINQHR